MFNCNIAIIDYQKILTIAHRILNLQSWYRGCILSKNYWGVNLLTYFTYFVHVNTFSAYRLLQSISHIPIKSVWQKSHKSHCTVWISCTTLVDLQSGERIWQHHLPRQHLPVIAVTLNLCPHTLALAGILFNQTFFHRLLQVRPGPSRASKGQPLGIDESGLYTYRLPFLLPSQ